jgi:hypothetical protein
VGEVESVWAHPGKQTWSITQGLYAGHGFPAKWRSRSRR